MRHMVGAELTIARTEDEIWAGGWGLGLGLGLGLRAETGLRLGTQST